MRKIVGEHTYPIFNMITVDAEQSIGEQHRLIRRLFLEGRERPWSDWNADAVAEWLENAGAGADRCPPKSPWSQRAG